LTEWAINGFPTSPDFFSTSLAHKILLRLSLSLLFVTYSTRSDVLGDLPDLRRQVELVAPVLDAIAPLLLLDLNTTSNPLEDPGNDFNPKAKKSQRQRKLAKRAGRNSAVDLKLFDDLKVAVPASSAEAKALATELLVKQKSLLQVCRLLDVTEDFITYIST
jgi:hypothetical protein